MTECGEILQEEVWWWWKWDWTGIEHFWIRSEKSKCWSSHEQEDRDSRSRKALLVAVELYQQEAPRDFCHYTTFAYRKLKQFVMIEKNDSSILSILCWACLQSILPTWSISSICTSKDKGKRLECRWFPHIYKTSWICLTNHNTTIISPMSSRTSGTSFHELRGW